MDKNFKPKGERRLKNAQYQEWGSDITTASTDVKIGDYYEQYYANKFNNFDEIDKFLEGHKLAKLT